MDSCRMAQSISLAKEGTEDHPGHGHPGRWDPGTRVGLALQHTAGAKAAARVQTAGAKANGGQNDEYPTGFSEPTTPLEISPK